MWRYQVLEAAYEQPFRLLVTEENGDRRFELWFEGARRRLMRVVKITENRRTDLIVHSGPDPYFGWSFVYPVIFDWPDLPQTGQDAAREFVDDDGRLVEEVTRVTAPSQFEIRMTSVSDDGAGYTQTRRSAQTWSQNSPWWSDAVIETEQEMDGEKSAQVDIRGRLIS